MRITLTELLELGFVRNPNLWIGSGYFHCPECRRYHMHDAYSYRVGSIQDDALVCQNCQNYHDRTDMVLRIYRERKLREETNND